jgi:hypothetical protein
MQMIFICIFLNLIKPLVQFQQLATARLIALIVHFQSTITSLVHPTNATTASELFYTNPAKSLTQLSRVQEEWELITDQLLAIKVDILLISPG